LALGLLGAGCFASGALAQSISIDDDSSKAAPKPPSPTSAPAPIPAPAPEPVIPPRALVTPITYPGQVRGEQDVVLELTISAQGTVTSALAISGEAPFTDAALEASKSWLFEPAKRGTRSIAAKIRFLVHFVPPREETTPEPAQASAPAASPSAPKAPAEPAMQEILVVGQKEPIKHTLGRADVHDMPGAFGDPYRAIEALPGVVPIASGLPYFYVRGAPPGNVGYFFDGIPVPYLYHFAAGPGVLQPAFVDHVDLYPGAYPARYGRFAGAIVAGEMAPPTYRLRGEASIRWIDSGATVEAPFASGRGSAMIGGRFSYTAAVLSLLVPEVSVNYWDYQARIRYALDSKNSVEVLSFGAGDFLSETETGFRTTQTPNGPSSQRVTEENTIVDVGFHRLDLRWDRRLSEGNWRNALMLGYDRTGADNGNVTVRSRMVGLRSEYRQALDKRVTLRAGGDVLFETLAQNDNSGQVARVGDSGAIGSSDDDGPNFGLTRARRDLTSGLWTDLVLAVSPKLEITPGLRADLFVSGGRIAFAVDPRISVRYRLSKKLSVTHGLALVHQAPSFVVPVPGFKPSLEGGLQSAVQYSAGLSYALPAGFESSLALFQNVFFNMTDLVSLVQLQSTTSKDEQDFRATGHAYGFELMLRRSLSRRVGGYVSYTLSRSMRSSGELEGPATTDRTHVVNVALSADLGRDWRLGGRWLFYSGIPAHVAYVAAAKAPPRTPPFWRLDFKLQKRWYIKRPDVWWGIALEVLNTTLNKEVLNGDCNALACKFDSIGPVTIPSIGAEGAF
jgi:TonB family protein